MPLQKLLAIIGVANGAFAELKRKYGYFLQIKNELSLNLKKPFPLTYIYNTYIIIYIYVL